MEDFASQQMLEQKEKDPLDGIGKKGGARAFSTETEDGARHLTNGSPTGTSL